MEQQVREIEEALVGHWSLLGRWPGGALVEDRGTLRYETPIGSLPYNGVIRTSIDGDAGSVVDDVLTSFRDRGVSCVWWAHPSAKPRDLGALLADRGLELVERATGMALELDGASLDATPADVEYVEVVDEAGMRAYDDLIISYWELPETARDAISELNRFWGPGRAPAHRWVALLDGRPVGKALLSLAAPPGIAAIYGMSVRPEARGRGVALGLSATLLRRARELGCRRVVLHSTAIAAGLYRRLGFVERCTLDVYANAPLWSGRDH